ncbi:hypothetical protein HG535_0F03970 [Zygotorulaspora mrakii]|uniref:RNase MRP protein 1 RNA binding domain-containing protein n=1 Tax=Zygotorulaspora mrakii TaxID=42260 RepID=A0A7H9B5C1_ZYGMR|nr:uncharacterized protein HG535_0F03970 [Zygotorulaspora mrakii]QLG73885.1 hypothetical protein HG535_0F03970 [Zygotorulaspora mrakii]
MDATNDPDSHAHRGQYLKLLQEFRLLHLLYHRNKNQHRVAHWWRYINILKRNCSEVLEVIQKKVIDKEFDFAKLYQIINKFKKKILPKIYYEFNGIIALGQFVTLGVILVCLLSRVYAIYKDIYAIYSGNFERISCQSIDNSARKKEEDLDRELKIMESLADEELGEEITNIASVSEDQLTHINIQPSPHVERQKIKKKKSKKKKAKSVIDGIFG